MKTQINPVSTETTQVQIHGMLLIAISYLSSKYGVTISYIESATNDTVTGMMSSIIPTDIANSINKTVSDLGYSFTINRERAFILSKSE